MSTLVEDVRSDRPSLLADLAPVSGWRLTAHELVRTTLRRGILTGTLAGGTRLVQAEIADQLQVSTTPVREALRDLATEGLIRLDTHRGAVVRSIDPREAREIYDLRLMLEPMAMRKAAAHITEDELARAEELHERMTNAADSAEWVDLNRRFHQLLTGAGRGTRLPALVASLQDSSAIYVGAVIQSTPQLRAKGDAEHRLMLEALRQRDDKAAAEAICVHLGTTTAAMLPESSD